MARARAAGIRRDGLAAHAFGALAANATPNRYLEGTDLVPLQAQRIEGLEVQKVVVVGGRAYFGGGANHRELLLAAGLDPSAADTTGIAYFKRSWSLARKVATKMGGGSATAEQGDLPPTSGGGSP